MTPQRQAQIREEIRWLVDALLDCYCEQDQEGIDNIREQIDILHCQLDLTTEYERPPELI